MSTMPKQTGTAVGLSQRHSCPRDPRPERQQGERWALSTASAAMAALRAADVSLWGSPLERHVRWRSSGQQLFERSECAHPQSVPNVCVVSPAARSPLRPRRPRR